MATLSFLNKILTATDAYGESEIMEIAKGKNDLKQSFVQQFKRRLKWQLKK
jgi:hypothetical protein